MDVHFHFPERPEAFGKILLELLAQVGAEQVLKTFSAQQKEAAP